MSQLPVRNQTETASPARRPRLVFLGADVNLISIKCLEALVRENRYEFLVGIDRRSSNGGIRTIQHVWKRLGAMGIVRRIASKLNGAVRFRLRRWGLTAGEPQSLRELAWLNRYPTMDCRGVNGRESLDKIRSFNPDLIVVANFSQRLRAEILAIPRLGAINFHPTLLPQYRGPTPYYWILQNGERESGVTVHYMDEQFDTGDVILQATQAVALSDNEFTLRDRSIEIGAPLLAEAVRRVIAGTAPRIPQQGSGSHFGPAPRGASRL